jgi:hypothetical protein
MVQSTLDFGGVRMLGVAAMLVGILALGAGVPEKPVPQKLLDLAREAAGTAARLRGVRAVPVVRTEVTDRASVEKYLEQRLQATDTVAEVALNGAALACMGAIDADVDLVAVLRKFARDQVAGYYDWQKKTLYVADWLPEFLQKPALVHESVHAIQDAKIGLAKFMNPVKGFSEPFVAAVSLLEGDATLVMMDAMANSEGPDPEADRAMVTVLDGMDFLFGWMPGTGDVPPVVRDSLLFPYMGGIKMLLQVRARAGWAGVDALYERPPLTTEQVLHPERLAGPSRDDPVDVDLAVPPPGPGWASLGTDIHGELGVRLILEQAMPKVEAAKAAEGWDGDRYRVFGRGKDRICVWASVWDSEAEAAEAEAALRQTKKPPLALQRRRDRIVGVWGTGAADPVAIVQGAWAGIRIREVHDLDTWVGRKKPGASRSIRE